MKNRTVFLEFLNIRICITSLTKPTRKETNIFYARKEGVTQSISLFTKPGGALNFAETFLMISYLCNARQNFSRHHTDSTCVFMDFNFNGKFYFNLINFSVRTPHHLMLSSEIKTKLFFHKLQLIFTPIQLDASNFNSTNSRFDVLTTKDLQLAESRFS